MEAVIKSNCNRFILAHNHPMGTCMPSKADVALTLDVWQTLSRMNIQMADHVIAGRDGEWSMRFNRSLPEIWED